MKRLNTNKRRVIKNRNKLKRINVDRYRITVIKSLKNISAQIIDDKKNQTKIGRASCRERV